MARESGKELLSNVSMLEIGSKIVLKVMVHILGLMVTKIILIFVFIGDRYDGEWFASRKQGRGSDFFANGDTYNGEYKNGKPNG